MACRIHLIEYVTVEAYFIRISVWIPKLIRLRHDTDRELQLTSVFCWCFLLEFKESRVHGVGENKSKVGGKKCSYITTYWELKRVPWTSANLKGVKACQPIWEIGRWTPPSTQHEVHFKAQWEGVKGNLLFLQNQAQSSYNKSYLRLK